ncbi:unnamed protein product [Rotaria magnacalcarata]|uniref:Uncharacterized protein n=1 Tax=Rotaria magnacalcarata TaxID=392030 RepID=A0A8S2T0C6_9BILA|nr:unnamed protein product [Rotaria magnacalcarata]
MLKYQLEQQRSDAEFTDLSTSSETNPSTNDVAIAWIDRIDSSLDTIVLELQAVREELRLLRQHFLNN